MNKERRLLSSLQQGKKNGSEKRERKGKSGNTAEERAKTMRCFITLPLKHADNGKRRWNSILFFSSYAVGGLSPQRTIVTVLPTFLQKCASAYKRSELVTAPSEKSNR